MRRALLIGVQTGGLVGVAADIAAMTGLLGRHGFTEISTLQDAAADRAGILAAIRGLIARARAGDAVVLYYSGHGWRLERRLGGALHHFQGIAPWDIDKTTRDDFRAILSVELAALLAELTEKTANVTAIFDCCHATGVMRGERDAAPRRPSVRALPVPWVVEPEALFAALAAEGGAMTARDAECNPHAIRVYAASPSQPAHEDRDPAHPGGWLTKALVATLDAADGGRVWADVERNILEYVRRHEPDQRPVVVGPARRLLFREEQRGEHGATACVRRGEHTLLLGGTMLDLRVGDRFLAADANPAELVVTGVHSQFAEVTAVPADAALASGVTARPIHGVARGAVLLALPEDLRRLVAAVVTASGRLVVADPELAAAPESPPLVARVVAGTELAAALESPPLVARVIADTKIAAAPGNLPLVARVVIEDGRLELQDADGRELGARWSLRGGRPDESTLAELGARLERLGHAATLRRLTSVFPLPPPPSFTLQWFAVEPALRSLASLSLETGEMSPGTGPSLPAGARVTAHARNVGDAPLYVTHLLVQADGAVTLLSRAQPAGHELEPGAEYWLGAVEFAAVSGVALPWPGDVPRRDGPRTACLRTVVSDMPVDLRAWETAAVGVGGPTRSGSASRSPAPPLRPARYAVLALDLQIVPT